MTKIIVLGDTYSSRHKTGFNHPENPKRISALAATFQKRGIPFISADRTREVKPEIIHNRRYLDSLRELIARIPHNDQYEDIHYLVALDEDTYASAESLNVALAGLALQEQAIDLLLADPTHAKPIPFIVTRPPGHHARPDAAMGFCLFNTDFLVLACQSVYH